MDAKAPTSTRKIETLEGLRGLCALSVLFSHIAYSSTEFHSGGAEYFPGYIAGFFASFGNIGVLLFFVLSGYVIGKSVREPFSPRAARNYVIRRIIRLYPIYFIIVVVSFIAAAEPILSVPFLIHAAFMQTWLSPAISTNLALWTLHMEMIFYILFLFIWSKVISLRTCLWLSAGCCVVSPFLDVHLVRVLAYFFLWLLGLSASHTPRLAEPSGEKWFWPAMLLAIAFTQASAIEIIIRKAGANTHGQMSTLSVFIASGLLAAVIVECCGADRKAWSTTFWTSFVACGLSVIAALAYAAYANALTIPTYRLAMSFLLLAAMAVLFTIPMQVVWLGRLAWLGAISYALYLVHSPVVHSIYPFLPRDWPVSAWWCVNTAVMALCVLLATILERVIQPVFQSKSTYFR
jgi:peptidoglycan/LPS O-acetylase OafA/YrhL